MIDTIQDDIIDQLETVEGVKTVDIWQGDIEELIRVPQKLPSLHVLYQGAVFEPFEQAGENTTAALDFMIVLIAQSHKSRSAGATGANTIIEGVRDVLIGHQVDDYDFLRPVREDLLMAEGSTLVYGLIYRMSNVLIATE